MPAKTVNNPRAKAAKTEKVAKPAKTGKAAKPAKAPKTKESKKQEKPTEEDVEKIEELKLKIIKTEVELRKMHQQLAKLTGQPARQIVVVAGKKKKTRDPDAPKKPKSSFMVFSTENRDKIKQQNPEATFGDIASLVSEAWKALSEKDKKKYTDKADKSKEKYQKELEKYNKDHGITEDSEKLLKKIQKACSQPDTYYNVSSHKKNKILFTEKGKPKGKAAHLVWYQLNDFDNIRICGDAKEDADLISETLTTLGFEDATPTYEPDEEAAEAKGKAAKGKGKGKATPKGKGKAAKEEDAESDDESDDEGDAESDDESDDEGENDEGDAEGDDEEEEEVEKPKKK